MDGQGIGVNAMEPRAFSKKQREAVSLVTGREGQADHVTPHSAGGKTAVENCQLIGADTNRRKGAFRYIPRDWQKEFQHEWDGRNPGRPFLLIVIPGGGKTMAALEAARRWMAAGADRRIIVVVPTDNLREQWREEAVRFGIELQTKEFGTNFKHEFQGGVATYHLVANSPLVFRKLCANAPTMVIFDEIHHCGDEAHFGRGITQAFELAKDRLLLSGTPWKSDGTPIPYVQYDGNGYAVGNFSYDYPRALNEGVVRYLVFDYSRGTITNDATGEAETLSSEAADGDASRVLGRLLDARGDFVQEQIRQSHRKLLEIRATTPDAAALAACMDQTHAMQVAEMIRRVTGCEPSVIVSDSDLENDTVRDFRASSREWLVAVRKVSEGTDIKRLQVLCYLTNTTAELFFRQLIGRVSRYRDGEDREGYVYLPADPRLIRCAQNIENAQVQALREQVEADGREFGPGDGELLGGFDSYSTAHDGTDLVMVGNESVPQSVAREVERVAALTGVPMQKVLQVMSLTGTVPAAAPEVDTVISKEERIDKLRRSCNGKTVHIAGLEARLAGDGDTPEVIRKWIKAVHKRFKPHDVMTEDDLRNKLAALAARGKEIAALIKSGGADNA